LVNQYHAVKLNALRIEFTRKVYHSPQICVKLERRC